MEKASVTVIVAHDLEISAVCDLDRRGVTLAREADVPFARGEPTLRADGPCSEAEPQRVAAEAAKCCPLSKPFPSAGRELIERREKK